MSLPGGIRAGQVSKPYGVQGQVVLILEPAAARHIQNHDPLFVELDGQRVPFFLEEFERLSDTQALAAFEFIHSVEEARTLCGHSIYLDPARAKVVAEGPDDLSRYVGYEAEEKDGGPLGPVTGYLADSLNPMWLIDHRGRELLVPAVQAFVHSVDPKRKKLVLTLPDGLTSL
ncbi:MAG: hypothetical protein R2751_17690 [Bacteroidales bacterium]